MKRIILIIIICNPFLFSQKLSAEEIFKNYNDALVIVKSLVFNGENKVQGSGVIIHDSGYVVTNYHNFKDSENLVVLYKGKEINGDAIVGADLVRDLLVIKINGKNFKSIKKADLKNINIGQKIFTIGSPLGLKNTITEGIISGIRFDKELNRNVIQITAPITHGNSGGALLNESGELLGITTSIARSKDGEEHDNIGFAIPIDELKKINAVNFSNKVALNLMNNYFRGINAYSSGNYNKSIDYLNKCAALSKEHTFIYLQLGLAYSALEELDSAEINYKFSLKIDSNYAPGYAELGYIYIKKSNYKLARNYLNKALMLDSSLSNAYNNLAATYLFENDHIAAIDVFKVLIRKNPYFDLAYLNLGVAYNELNLVDTAIEFAKVALKYNRSSAEIYYNLGTYYYRIKDFYSAIDYFNAATNINRNYSNAFSYLGEAYNSVDDQDNAIKSFRKVLELKNKPKNDVSKQNLIRSYYGLGLAYNNKNQTNKAIDNYNRCIEIDSTVGNAYIGLANIAESHNDSLMMIKYLEMAVNKDTTKWILSKDLGKYYARRKEFDKAMYYYDYCLSYDSLTKDIIYGKAYIYYDRKQYDNSKELIDKVIALDSTYADALNLKGAMLSKEGNDNDACNYFLLAIKYSPENANFKLNLAYTYLKRNKRDEAIKYFKQAAEGGLTIAEQWLKQNKLK